MWVISWECPSGSSSAIRSPDRDWLSASSAISLVRKCVSFQDADDIYIEKMHDYKMDDGTELYDHVWQAGTVLLSTIRSVGVMGDERTYEHPVALRAVTSMDAMTADWAHLPYDFLADVSNEIIRKVKGVNRVCYDVSSKPPATIEWE